MAMEKITLKRGATGAQKTVVTAAALLASFGICRLRKDVLNVLSEAIPEHKIFINMINFLCIILGVEISSGAIRITYNVFQKPKGLKYVSKQLEQMPLILKGPLVHSVMALMVFGLLNVMSDIFYMLDGKNNSSLYNLKFLALFTTIGIMISATHYYFDSSREAKQSALVEIYNPQVS